MRKRQNGVMVEATAPFYFPPYLSSPYNKRIPKVSNHPPGFLVYRLYPPTFRIFLLSLEMLNDILSFHVVTLLFQIIQNPV